MSLKWEINKKLGNPDLNPPIVWVIEINNLEPRIIVASSFKSYSSLYSLVLNKLLF